MLEDQKAYLLEEDVHETVHSSKQEGGGREA